MKIYAIVQARMSSKRFPGKTLYKINNIPLICFMLERIKQCDGLDGILVATSMEKGDDPIFNYCKENDVSCHRGSLDNVAERYKDTIEANNFDAFVRLSGDSPLIDYHIVEKAITLFRDNKYDIVTNVLERSFPKGQSVELVGSKVFLNAYQRMDNAFYYEHVTSYFYEHKMSYNICNFKSGIRAGDIQLSVDTEADMEVFEQIIEKMDRPHWEYGWEEIVKLHDSIIHGR